MSPSFPDPASRPLSRRIQNVLTLLKLSDFLFVSGIVASWKTRTRDTGQKRPTHRLSPAPVPFCSPILFIAAIEEIVVNLEERKRKEVRGVIKAQTSVWYRQFLRSDREKQAEGGEKKEKSREKAEENTEPRGRWTFREKEDNKETRSRITREEEKRPRWKIKDGESRESLVPLSSWQIFCLRPRRCPLFSFSDWLRICLDASQCRIHR